MNIFNRFFKPDKPAEETPKPEASATIPPAVTPAPSTVTPQPSTESKPSTNETYSDVVSLKTTTTDDFGKTAPLTIENLPKTTPISSDTVPIAPPPTFSEYRRAMDGVTRPLPVLEKSAPINKNAHIIFGTASDVGMVRSNNQDSAITFFTTSRSVDERPDFGLFIVADGMGGHHDGEKASAVASRVTADSLLDSVYMPILKNSDMSDRVPMNEALSEAVLKANSSVIQQVQDGGTTLTSVVVLGDIAYIAHVGDSRAYLINQEGIEQITRDHSLVQRLVELDQITPEEAADHNQKNVLYRALGQAETLEVDTLMRRLPIGSKIVMCSDGLWGLVKDREILEVVNAYPNPQDACERLIALANTRGGQDNITVIILRMPG